MPFDHTLHDYYVLSPNPFLEDRSGRFVGEDLATQGEEMIRASRFVERPPANLAVWQQAHRWLVADAERVIAPSRDTARRLRRFFPEVDPVVAAHPGTLRIPAVPAVSPLLPGSPPSVALVGQLIPEKGLATEYLATGAHYCQANGVFAVKSDSPRLLPFLTTSACEAAGLSPRVVYLTRHDLVAQAVSMYRVTASGQWNSLLPARSEPEFDLDRILGQLQYLAQMMAGWEALLSLHAITPLRIVYEEVIANPEAAVRSVAAHLGITVSVDRLALSTHLRRQTDRRSQEWCARVRAALDLGIPVPASLESRARDGRADALPAGTAQLVRCRDGTVDA